MKKQTIRKGFHRPFQLIPPCLKFFSVRKDFYIRRTFFFTKSCRYMLDGGDQMDWNKLFGFCYGVKGIHVNSVRFAWRYSASRDMIEIATYCYKNSKRIYKIVGTVCIGKPVTLSIRRCVDIEDDVIFFLCGFNVVDRIIIESDKFVFGCGLYFGGNRRAPQDIIIYSKSEKYEA
ncbi:MAG: hypothetical protein IKM23_02510 [Bacteroidales bacterium]|nr:hypothetical protein [Bacteroidales bacterium]